MNPTMNSQEHKTTLTDPSSMMISLQLHNLILKPNLKPKTTSHSQTRRILDLVGLSLPLSIENFFHRTYSRRLTKNTLTRVNP